MQCFGPNSWIFFNFQKPLQAVNTVSHIFVSKQSKLMETAQTDIRLNYTH